MSQIDNLLKIVCVCLLFNLFECSTYFVHATKNLENCILKTLCLNKITNNLVDYLY